MKATISDFTVGGKGSELRLGRSQAKDLLIAKAILDEIMPFRRLLVPDYTCGGVYCPKCSFSHLKKITAAVKSNLPITFVLPAFPGKSPNKEKVLGHLPDLAEILSLDFLDTLNQRIKRIYIHGAKTVLCSDGRVFSDIVGIDENELSEYQAEIKELIKSRKLTTLETFDLGDIFDQFSFRKMRDELMKSFGESIEALKHKVQSGATETATLEQRETNSVFRGITRFLVEDRSVTGQSKSRSAIQKECKAKAYEVIRRSNAWSSLIADRFPEAVRLSIHPQVCGSRKFGIQLVGTEAWMTPWHGVAVQTENGFILLKRSRAEALGAKLIHFSNGRPSHFELVNQNHVSKLGGEM